MLDKLFYKFSDVTKTVDQNHTINLNKLCRICGGILKKPMLKTKFADEIERLFGIDIKDENSEIFPNHICSMHCAVFYRCRTALKKNEAFSTDLFPVHFEMHSDNCKVCNLFKGDVVNSFSKESSKWTPPGRGKRCATYLSPKTDKKQKTDGNKIWEMFKSVPAEDKKSQLNSFVKLLTREEKTWLIDSLFEEEQNSVNKDIEHIQDRFSSISNLNELDVQEYLKEQNPFLMQTLLQVTQASIDKDFYRLAVLLESIYKLRNANFIGPVSTLQNLVLLSITNSKSAVDICGSSGAGGKYTTLCKWLGNIPSEPKNVPKGDILFAFDNEQVIGKTWNIKPNNKIKTSIITTVAAFELQTEKQLQSDFELHPSSWFTQKRVSDVVDKVLLEEDELYNTFKKEHFNQFRLFVNAAIQQILDESTDTDKDIIDKMVADCKQKRELKTCPACETFFPKTKRKCPHCKIDLTKLPDSTPNTNTDNSPEHVEISPLFKQKSMKKDKEGDNFRFEHVKHFHQEGQKPVFVMDPVFVNPNSVENLKLVLRHLGTLAGIKRYGGDERDWVIICCDGLPYTMVRRMIEEYFTCAICSKGFLGNEAFDLHKKEHPDIEDVKFVREFDWIILKMGDGHYEMNLMKAFVELNWDIFMKPLVNRMGWTSEAAMKAAKMCYDNHKTWQLILTFHLGTLQELVLPYVRKCQNNDGGESVTPTSTGFLQFAKTMENNPNYMYMFEMVSRYSQAIINFRMGIRRNNSNLVHSAKFMSKGLFHGRVHPRYQQIEMLDSVHRFLLPEKLLSFLNENESISKTGDISKGQGFDFILEEINRDIKSWIRRGVATDNMWLGVCRNFDRLNELRSKLNKFLKLEMESTSIRKINLDDAINDWRVCLREKRYLLNDKFIHESIQGHPLNEGLLKFTE